MDIDVDWNLSDVLDNFTVSTDGLASDVATSWPTSGDIVSVRSVTITERPPVFLTRSPSKT